MIARFRLDEHVSPKYRRQLLRRNPELMVWRVGDTGAPPTGSTDPVILRWCEEDDFLLVTSDRSTMPAHLRQHLAAGRHVPGVVMLSASLGIGAVLSDLLIIAEAGEPADLADRITFLPI
jgi:hypothetical protein